VLKIEQLARAWPEFTLGVSLELGEREIGAILGPSGSGKSSLLRLIAGLERPDSGRIFLDERDLTQLPPEKRGIGMVFQDYALFPAMTVAQNISYGPRLAGLRRAERNRITQELASKMGIARYLDRYPAALSGGERQRVALARTIAASPRLVLLDEPLSSLDENLRKQLRLELASRLRESESAALHVTHDVEEAMAVADRIFLMRDGAIEAAGDAESLFSDPPSAWVAAFMGCGPVIPVEAVEGSAAAILARCILGTIACTDSSKGVKPEEPCSVFFNRDAARLETHRTEFPFARIQQGGINRFTCRVESSFLTGSSRRVLLSVEDMSNRRGVIEIDVPRRERPERGEQVDVCVPVSCCKLLPGVLPSTPQRHSRNSGGEAMPCTLLRS